MNLSLYLLTVLIWGTTWIALKFQLGGVAIPVSIVYRFALAALILFAVLLLTRRLQPMGRRGHQICLAQGLCLFCINFICFLSASQWIASGLIAVVFSTATLWNAINARLFFGRQVAPHVLGGGALGLLGLGLLYLIFRWRTTALRRQQQLLRRRVLEQTQELHLAKDGSCIGMHIIKVLHE